MNGGFSDPSDTTTPVTAGAQARSPALRLAKGILKRSREELEDALPAKKLRVAFQEQPNHVVVDNWIQKHLLHKQVESYFKRSRMDGTTESLTDWKDFFKRFSAVQLLDILEHLEFPRLEVFCFAYNELIQQVEKIDFLGNKVEAVQGQLRPKVQAMFRASFFTEMIQKGIKEDSFADREEFQLHLNTSFKEQLAPSSTLTATAEEFLGEFDPSSRDFWEEFFLYPFGIINHGLIPKGADQSLNWMAFQRSVEKLGITPEVFTSIKEAIQADEKRVVMDLTEAIGHLLIGEKVHNPFTPMQFMEYVTLGVVNCIGSLQNDSYNIPFIDTNFTSLNQASLRRGESLYKRLKGSFEGYLNNSRASQDYKEACKSLISDCEEVLKKFRE